MKFISTLTILLVTSVTLLYYLLNNQNFLPIDQVGKYNWINISIFLILASSSISSLLSLLIHLLIKALGKDIPRKTNIILTVKYSLLITVGIFAVFILNFFEILNIAWGVGILFVVLMFSFII